MLKYDKNERISACKAISHVFILFNQPTNKCILEDLVMNRIVPFVKKNKFLRLLAFQYSSRWRDSYCKPLKEAFDHVDVDNDGIISYNEFKAAFELFNSCSTAQKFTSKQIDIIFQELDANDNGQIDWLEFQCLFSSQFLFENEKSLLNEFRRLDMVDRMLHQNGDGLIDSSEIMHHLSKFNGELNDKIVMDMIEGIDLDNDGKVVYGITHRYHSMSCCYLSINHQIYRYNILSYILIYYY